MRKNVFKNILSILFGRGIDLIVNFIAVTLIARSLGASDYGIFTSTVAFVFILSKLIDFGFAQIVFRETSLKQNSFTYLNNAISIRLALLVCLVIIYNIISLAISIEPNEQLYTNILFIGIIFSAKFQNFRELLEIPFKVDLKMNYVMIFNIIDNILLLILVLALFLMQTNLLFIVLVYVFANTPGFILFIFYLVKKYNYRFKFEFDKSKWLIQQSLPLFGAVLLFSFFQQLDVILIKNFVSSYEAGLFSAALRLAMPLGVVPLALITTAFPLITKNKNVNDEGVREIIIIVFKVLFAFSFFAALFATFKAEELIILVFGIDFKEAAEPTIIIFWASLFIFFSNFIQNVLTIYDKQKSNFVYAILLVLFNLVVLYLLLIEFKSNGAAIAKLAASLLGFIYLIYILIKVKLFKVYMSINTLLWILLLGFIVYLLKDLDLVTFTLAFSIISVLSVLFIKYFTKRELLLLQNMMNNPKWFPKFLIK